MVVVYSGDNQGPPIDWEASVGSGPATVRETPAEPFYLPRDLPLPSIPDFEALAPPILESAAERARPEREGVAAFDGKPVAAYAPGEIDALVAYELARAEFRAELETPSVRREVRVAPVPVPVLPPVPAPVAPEPARVVSYQSWPLVVGGLALGVALAIALAFGANRSSPSRGAEAVSSGAAFASALASEALAAPTATAPAAALQQAPLPSSATPSPSARPELDPERRSTKVVLTVFPADAKVTLRGMKRRGPPYEFDIPRGRRVAIEVSRKGYTARKVVLDGREAELTIGLSPDKRHTGDAAGDVAERGIGVRSGL
jgi:hypothetical protein